MRDRSHQKTVGIDNEIYFAVKEIAQNNRRTVKETVSIILEEYIEKYKKENEE